MCRTNNNLVALSPFKQFKELKETRAQYGPNAPLMQMLLEYRILEALHCGKWKQLDQACLSDGDYLLSKTKHEERCWVTDLRNLTQQIPFSFYMLTGE